MRTLKHWMEAIEANLFQLILNYPALSLQEINDRIAEITRCIEEIVEIKVEDRLDEKK